MQKPPTYPIGEDRRGLPSFPLTLPQELEVDPEISQGLVGPTQGLALLTEITPRQIDRRIRCDPKYYCHGRCLPL